MSISELPPWSFPLRFLFRFTCLYWPLYILLVFRPVAPWVATNVFHVTGEPATYFRTGSGDTTLAYISFLLCFLTSLVGAILWSLLDHRRPHYRAAHAWLHLLMRYMLAFPLFSYGFDKVFPLQFPANSLLRLSQTYGEFSPMGVIWSFMGASQGYTLFAGLAEVIPGLLLCFRRTTTLGALLACAVMSNVMALNFFYDIPVKLYSTHLFLMGVFLLVPDIQRIFRFFVLNQPVQPADLSAPRFENRRLRVATSLLLAATVGANVGSSLWSGHNQYRQVPERPPLYGLYRVESGAPSGWHRVIFESPRRLFVRDLTDKLRNFAIDYDIVKKSFTLNKDEDLAAFTWSIPEPSRLLLTGTFQGEPTTIRLRRVDTEIPITNRGFHWISEHPFNR